MVNMALFYPHYHLVIYHSHGKSPFLIGKPSINGQFPMAMLNNQRVTPLLLGWCPQVQQVQPWGNRRRDPPRGSQVWYLDVPVTADRDIWRSQFIKMEGCPPQMFFFFPKWMVYSGTSYLYPIKIYDLGFVVEYFLLTSYWKNTLW